MIEYWVWLSQVPYIGPKTAKRLIEAFGRPEDVYYADSDMLTMQGRLSPKQINSITDNRSLEASLRIIEKCQKNGIHILALQDENYPQKAKLSDAPIVLYYKGSINKTSDSVGIVGARRCSRDERQAAIEAGNLCAKDGTVVISGMAKGVDSYAHTSCIKAGGYTIAILANGLDICYPKEHDILMRTIEERGMLLSEYPPGVRPTSYSFPRRNRLISAWSDKLIVIGAGKRSGALITAEFSEKYGKPVQYVSCSLRDS